MQRIVVLCIALLPSGASAQDAAGTALWRLAGTTLALPPALARGAAGAFWNPAQAHDSAGAVVAVEGIQTPAALGAVGAIATVRMRVRPLGELGLIYGRMGLSDLVRTSDSPAPVGGTIPYFTSTIGLTWARRVLRTGVGVTLAYRDTRLDSDVRERWTFDVGVARQLTGGVRIAAATHFWSGTTNPDPAQDVYAGVEVRLWRGPLWGSTAAFHARYGVTTAHRFGADQHGGLGVSVGDRVRLDLLVAREGGYAASGWRGAAGLEVAIGRYRLGFSRDAGVSDIGSAYRVGLEARFP